MIAAAINPQRAVARCLRSEGRWWQRPRRNAWRARAPTQESKDPGPPAQSPNNGHPVVLRVTLTLMYSRRDRESWWPNYIVRALSGTNSGESSGGWKASTDG